MKNFLKHNSASPSTAFSPRQSGAGFIALISVVILSAVLLIAVVTLNFTGFISRATIANSEYKEVSTSLAEACANTAILKLANDWSYTGNETITINGKPCKIFTITLTGVDPQTLKVQAIYNQSYTNLVIVIPKSTFKPDSWKEVDVLP